MRSTNEMMELLLTVAREDDRVRAVGMNGSRTNPMVPKDVFQDYDIVYVVTDMQTFLDDPSWIEVFGERIVMQTPEAIELIPPLNDGTFAYLMLFTDGNRIDLTLVPFEQSKTWNRGDTLAQVLLDKDQLLPDLTAPTDIDYWIQKPTQKFFDDCCNECWWVSTYVAKGLWRNELTYAYDHLSIVREMLIQMLKWKIGVQTDFSLSVGKNGKYLEAYLTKDEWDMFNSTYPRLEVGQMWKALFVLLDQFSNVSDEVAESLDFKQEIIDRKKVREYLKHVQVLPVDTKEIL